MSNSNSEKVTLSFTSLSKDALFTPLASKVSFSLELVSAFFSVCVSLLSTLGSAAFSDGASLLSKLGSAVFSDGASLLSTLGSAAFSDGASLLSTLGSVLFMSLFCIEEETVLSAASTCIGEKLKKINDPIRKDPTPNVHFLIEKICFL
nr:hypothetical protein [Staphylococcus aureus]